MRWQKSLTFLAVVLLSAWISAISSCVTRPIPQNTPSTHKSFDGYYEEIWDALVAAVEENGSLRMTHVNKDLGVLASDWVEEERTVFDAAHQTYTRYPSRYRINIHLRRLPAVDQPAGTETVIVTVNKQLQLKPGSEWKTWASDHETEAAILAAIDKYLNN
jgi:hypothetical protein